jgi:hypothetical protein
MNKNRVIGLSIVIGFSVLGVIGGIVSVIISCPKSITTLISTWVGIIGTIASIALSIIAMIYSNKSSKDAEQSLSQINKQYKALCNELTSREIQRSIGNCGVDDIIKKYEDKANNSV